MSSVAGGIDGLEAVIDDASLVADGASCCWRAR